MSVNFGEKLELFGFDQATFPLVLHCWIFKFLSVNDPLTSCFKKSLTF